MRFNFPNKSSKEGGGEWADVIEKTVRKKKVYLVEKRLRDGEEAFGVTHDEWRTYEPFKDLFSARVQVSALRIHHYWKRFEFRITLTFED